VTVGHHTQRMEPHDPAAWVSLRVSAAELVLFRQLQDEAVLLDMRGEQYYGLDVAGTSFWHALVATPSIAAAIDVLLDEFDVERAQLEADMGRLLSDLDERGLIVIEPRLDSHVA
jgi:hypothetical protein